MRRNLNLVARSFYDNRCSFSDVGFAVNYNGGGVKQKADSQYGTSLCCDDLRSRLFHQVEVLQNLVHEFLSRGFVFD